MWRQKDMIGSGRWVGLLGVSTLVLLAGCDWFGDSTPVGAPPRPGADKQVTASGALPPAGGGRQYDAGVVPVDETQGNSQIGSIIPHKGGQKAQKEAADKEAAERDAKDREERTKREAEQREDKARAAGTPGAPGAAQPAVMPAGAAPPTAEPVAVPPPAPVSTTPMPAPPSGSPLPEPGQVSPVPPPPDKPS